MDLQKPKPNYLPALTSMRFLAAFHVMLYHFIPAPMLQYWTSAASSHPFIYPLAVAAAQFISIGYIEVALFFILSGFILAYTYLDPDSGRQKTKTDFFVARLARIYPVYLCAWLFTGGLIVLKAVAHKGQPVAAVDILFNGITSLFCVQSWFPASAAAWNGPGWSISTEAFFYTLFPLLFFSKSSALLKNNAYLWGLIGIAFVVKIAAVVIYFAYCPDGQSFSELINDHVTPGKDLMWWQTLLQFGPIFRVGEFLLGVAMGRIFLAYAKRGDGRGSDIVAFLPSALLLSVYICFAAAGRVFLPRLALGIIIIPIQALVVYRLALPVSSWTGLLSRKSILLGEASYALYLFHEPIRRLADGVFNIKSTVIGVAPIAPLPIRLGCIIASIATSIVVYKLVEVPARRSVRSVANKFLANFSRKEAVTSLPLPVPVAE